MGRTTGVSDECAGLLQLERARQALNRYLSRRTREVAETTSRTGTLAPPEHRDVVILFTDIRGFTALSNEMETDRLFSVLSAQLAEQVNLVYEHGGYIDKFGGDGVMAVFDGQDRVVQSCLCALQIIDSGRVNDGSGDEKIRQWAIGIHAGEAMIGNIGSPEHLDYSVIGTAVNIASRLCAHADAMSVVVSKSVRDGAVSDSRLRFHSGHPVAIRGLKDPVDIYTLSRPQ